MLRMRPLAFHLLPTSLLISLATSLQLPDFRPFTSAIADIFHDALPASFDNATHHELLKRQSSGCPDQYANCESIGAPNLCCISNAVCSADQAGMVACCPEGAVCTGTITGYIQSGTVDSNGVLIGGGGAPATIDNGASTTSFQFYTTTPTYGLVPATQATTAAMGGTSVTGNGFIIAGTSTVATPAAGVRQRDVPYLISGIVYILGFLPI